MNVGQHVKLKKNLWEEKTRFKVPQKNTVGKIIKKTKEGNITVEFVGNYDLHGIKNNEWCFTNQKNYYNIQKYLQPITKAEYTALLI